jgi:membrane associated rhomboid family serine protease
MTVNHWPSCTDARSNTWRLVSSQFAHKGMTHIGGNTMLGLLYGIMLESLHPYHWFIAIMVYELGVIMGNLSFSHLEPFSTLVGCSSGIYALMGCCISHFILNKNEYFKFDEKIYKKINRLFYPFLSTIILIHAVCEIVIYFAAYDSQTAYSAHFGGLFNGIFIGLTFGLFQKPRWKKLLGLIGVTALLVLDISLFVHYLEAWPPQFLDYNPTFHP